MTNKEILDSIDVEGFYTPDKNLKYYRVKKDKLTIVFTCQEFTDPTVFKKMYKKAGMGTVSMTKKQKEAWGGESFFFLQQTPLQLPLFRLVQIAKEAFAGRKF